MNTTACGPNGSGIGDANSLDAGDFEVSAGTHKEVVVGRFTVPHDTKPGTYGIGVVCDNGKEAGGDLEVTKGGGSPKPEPYESAHHRPSGHVRTGVGGSVGPDTAQIAAGAGVLVAAAVGGTLLLRRRANGSQGG